MTSAIAMSRITLDSADIKLIGETSRLGPMHHRLIDENSSFDLASITKVFSTTTLIIRAIESQLLNLSDTLSKFMPEWKITDKSNITVEDLLRHESGLEEWRPFYISCHSPEEVLEKIRETPLKYQSKREFHYSDLNFIVLGEILKKIFARSLSETFEEEIVKPLALTQTRFSSPVDLKNVVATSIGDSIERKMVRTKKPYDVPEAEESFAGWRDYVLSGEINDGNSFHIFSGEAGHAGLFSSLSDINTFTQGVISGFIEPKRLAEFSRPRNSDRQGIGFRRFKMSDGEFAIGHFGFTGTGFAIRQDLAKGWVYLSNRLHTNVDYPSMDLIWHDEFKEFSFLD